MLLGICSEFDLTKAIADAEKKAESAKKKMEALAKKAGKKVETDAFEEEK